MVKLATGQKAVAFLKAKGVSVSLLAKAKLRDGDDGASLAGLTAHQRNRVLERDPAVVLRPARGRAQRRPPGRRRRADRRGDDPPRHGGQPFSIVRDPAWRPSLGPDNTTFRMSDLLLFAFEGKKDLLAPLG